MSVQVQVWNCNVKSRKRFLVSRAIIDSYLHFTTQFHMLLDCFLDIFKKFLIECWLLVWGYLHSGKSFHQTVSKTLYWSCKICGNRKSIHLVHSPGPSQKIFYSKNSYIYAKKPQKTDEKLIHGRLKVLIS